MNALIFFVVFFTASLGYSQCLIPGEAVATKVSLEGVEYYRVMFCENDPTTGKLKPLRCFTQNELKEFVETAEKPYARGKSFWLNMQNLGFNNHSDFDKKLKDFATQNPSKELCLSGEIKGKNEKSVERSTEYIAELFNTIYERTIFLDTEKYMYGPYGPIPRPKDQQITETGQK